MNLLQEYTIDYIRRNKRSSIGLMVAILTVTTMVSALCGYIYNSMMGNINYYLKEDGNWHSELFDKTYGSDLAAVRSFDSVEAVMIKGEWQTARIEDPRRSYLIFRNANREYWESMPEAGGIMEGRIPQAEGEIAISKQYFEHHPDLKIGDELILPVGKRISADGTEMDILDIRREGEQFLEEGKVTLKVVGKLDVTTSSQVPAYTAIGFLDDNKIRSDEEITVYLRFTNVRDTYKETPLIGEALGFEKDEFGEYGLKYNLGYLTKLFVLSPAQIRNIDLLDLGGEPLALLVMGVIAVAIFVMVIHNAFMLSANARLAQLGILASIGATPRQIRRSVVFEALALTVVPLPLGLVLGNTAVLGIIHFANENMSRNRGDILIFQVGWQSILPAVLMAILTVWWSALIPAKKISKMSPINAIRQGGADKLKRPGNWNPGRLFGVEGFLAGNAVRARKASYRTSVIAIGLSFVALTCTIFISAASEAKKTVYKPDARRLEESDILVTLYGVASPEDMKITQRIGDLKEASGDIWIKEEFMTVLLDKEVLSEEFLSSGGFEEASENGEMGVPIAREGKYRVVSNLVGLDDESFREYCRSLGIDPDLYYQEDAYRSVMYNRIEDVTVSTLRNPVSIPYLSLKPGDTMEFTEKNSSEKEVPHTEIIEAGAVTDILPPLAFNLTTTYGLLQFMPMSRLESLSENYYYGSTQKVTGILQAKDKDQIKPFAEQIREICESSFGSGDYRISDEIDYLEDKKTSARMMNLIMSFVTGMFALIGLSNAWATIRGSLNARRKEFAVLRSLGISPGGMNRMIVIEAMLLGITPLLGGIPVSLTVAAVFMKVNEISIAQWVPFVQWFVIVLYIAGLLGIMAGAYWSGARKLLKENIVEAIKKEVV